MAFRLLCVIAAERLLLQEEDRRNGQGEKGKEAHEGKETRKETDPENQPHFRLNDRARVGKHTALESEPKGYFKRRTHEMAKGNKGKKLAKAKKLEKKQTLTGRTRFFQ